MPRARAAQPAWAAPPLAERARRRSRGFRDAARRPARTSWPASLTARDGQADQPVAQRARRRARPHRLLPRRDDRGAGRRGAWSTTRRTALEELIAHEPLGVVANISAWNYPYFVGPTCSCPALLTGNAVLYKPSELRHAHRPARSPSCCTRPGVPADVFVPVRRRRRGRAPRCCEQPVDGVFFTGCYATGRRIAEALAGRHDQGCSSSWAARTRSTSATTSTCAAAAEALADGAFYNTGQSCCSVERIYVHEAIHDAFVDAFVRDGARLRRSATRRTTTTYIGPLTRREQLDVLEAQVADAMRQGRARAARAAAASTGERQLVRAHRARRRRPRHGGDARRELRPDHRHPGRWATTTRRSPR